MSPLTRPEKCMLAELHEIPGKLRKIAGKSYELIKISGAYPGDNQKL